MSSSRGLWASADSGLMMSPRGERLDGTELTMHAASQMNDVVPL